MIEWPVWKGTLDVVILSILYESTLYKGVALHFTCLFVDKRPRHKHTIDMEIYRYTIWVINVAGFHWRHFVGLPPVGWHLPIKSNKVTSLQISPLYEQNNVDFFTGETKSMMITIFMQTNESLQILKEHIVGIFFTSFFFLSLFSELKTTKWV